MFHIRMPLEGCHGLMKCMYVCFLFMFLCLCVRAYVCVCACVCVCVRARVVAVIFFGPL